jgi:hypothetical protein
MDSLPFPVINQTKTVFRVNCQSMMILQISGDQHSKGGDNFLLQHETREMGVVGTAVIQIHPC